MAAPAARKTGLERVLAFSLHVGACAIMGNAFRILFKPGPLNDWLKSQKGGHWQFLTNLGLAAALIHQSLSVLLDFVHSDGLAALKNAVGTVALPASFVITSLYWSIVLWSPEMMVPPDSILFLPLSLDLSIHAAPFVLLLTDFLLFSPPFSKQTRPFLVAVVATTAYTSWMEYCHSFNKSYPYPFLNEMTPSTRLPFYGFACLLLFAFFHVANYTHFAFDKLVGRDVKISKLQTERKIT